MRALLAAVLVVLSSPLAPAMSLAPSHGPDPLPLLPPDVALPVGPHACASGVDDTAFRVLYVLPPATLDHEEIRRPLIRAGIAAAQGLVAESSLPHGVDVRLKFFCDPDGEVEITKVRVPTGTTVASFATIVRDLRALGYDRANEKYWVVYESFVFCGGCAGQGNAWSDDRPGPENRNNGGAMYAITYLGNLGPQGHVAPLMHVMLHEASHTMGAVQLSAPHSSGGMHCTDGGDIMCYADGTPGADYDPTACPRLVVTRVGPELPYDCGADDYFHPAPGASSYLGTHWNLAGEANLFVSRQKV